jgi:hypothetical protein
LQKKGTTSSRLEIQRHFKKRKEVRVFGVTLAGAGMSDRGIA